MHCIYNYDLHLLRERGLTQVYEMLCWISPRSPRCHW
jgi:hypothetical protein